ncbi:MAG: CocE/NonD family hydrolase [Verrucomicrobiales bacterium]|nr:CocE/NonD family hydrolase [Verrucomicrobiales bacterium]
MKPRYPSIWAVALVWMLHLGQSASAAEARPAPPHRETILVGMRDGVRLATDLYLPEPAAGRYPVILVRTPYNKTGLLGLAADCVKRGYALAVQDVRGRYESEGENLPFYTDQRDGADTTAWIVKQPWSNGRIGTYGGSAGAITQMQLAASGTPHLDCLHLTVGAPSQYHDLAYSGGVFRKSLVEDWLRATKFNSNALPRWVAHPTFDTFWKERDAALRYRRVNAPAVHVGGYWDIFAQGTIDAFVGYQTKGGPRARGHQKLIMGPWTHGVFQDKAGEFKFTNAKKPPGGVQDSWKLFDRWLKGVTNGFEQLPAVTYYVVGDTMDPSAPGNVWRTAEKWPPVPTIDEKWYLHPDHTLSATRPVAQSPNRGPTQKTQADTGSLSFTYDPLNPAPTVGGIQLTIPAGPMDQAKREGRDDVLVFTSEAISDPVEFTGRVRAHLWVSSDAPDTDFFVTLCDVYPNGKSYNLCEGRLRMRFRDGFEREKRMQPGKVYPVNIDLWSTSVIFNRGHRLRVQVSSSSFPGFDPNPNTGDGFRENSRTQVARNSVLLDRNHPSHLTLPRAILAK